jgi:Family of unknown function (DUF5519)
MLSFSDCKRAALLILETPCKEILSFFSGGLRWMCSRSPEILKFELPNPEARMLSLNRVITFAHPKIVTNGGYSMNHLNKLEQEVSQWPDISIHPHRFGGKEFRLGGAEVGHVHTGGIVDIPFPRLIRDALLAEGLAEEHRWVPNSGWVTFHVGSEEDLERALWLMRLSYLRYSLKTASDPRGLLEKESAVLHLSPQFRSLLERFLHRAAYQTTIETLSA